jgi:hypothetical protein
MAIWRKTTLERQRIGTWGNRSCFWHLCAGGLGLAIGRLTELTRQRTSRDGSQYPLLISGALPQLAGARPDGRGYASSIQSGFG